MARNEQQPGSGLAKAIFLGLLGLALGLGIGRWTLVKKTEGAKVWKNVDRLHQMHLVPSGYNFVESNKSYETQLMSLIHDRLLHYDPVQDQLVPGLAKSYEVSPDSLTWTFRLRDAQNPDGLALSAEDVVYSFNLYLDKRFDSNRRGNFILGGKPVEVASSGPATVTFRLAEPFHSFPWAISNIMIVPKATFQTVSGDEKTFRQAVGVQQPDTKYLRGFGPYSVESQDTQELRLVRNEKFWGRGDEQAPQPFLKEITLVLRKEDVTTEGDFTRDDRFAYRMIGPMEADRLSSNTDFEILDRGRSGWCVFFWVNQNPLTPWGKTHPGRLKLFQDVNFRRAMAHAIDRNAIIRHVFRGRADTLYGPVSPIFRWAARSETLEEVTPKFDTSAALAELAKLDVTLGDADASGKRWMTYVEGVKRIPLEFEIRTSKDEEDRRRKIAEEVKTQLEVIGIRVTVVEERFGEMVQRLDKSYDYEAAVMLLEGMPDAAVLKYFFESSGPMHFVNPRQKSPATEWERQVDELFRVYSTSPDVATRDQAILDLQKTWAAAQPAFHLVNDRKQVAVRRDFEINGMALTGRAPDPILTRTVIENVRIRRLVAP